MPQATLATSLSIECNGSRTSTDRLLGAAQAFKLLGSSEHDQVPINGCHFSGFFPTPKIYNVRSEGGNKPYQAPVIIQSTQDSVKFAGANFRRFLIFIGSFRSTSGQRVCFLMNKIQCFIIRMGMLNKCIKSVPKISLKEESYECMY